MKSFLSSFFSRAIVWQAITFVLIFVTLCFVALPHLPTDGGLILLSVIGLIFLSMLLTAIICEFVASVILNM